MNSCISIDRKKKKRKDECPLTTDVERLMQSDQDTSRGANVKMLYERIHQLNPFNRAIIMLWLEGMPYEEIGEILGITTKNVSVKLIRIKEQLKKMSNGK